MEIANTKVGLDVRAACETTFRDMRSKFYIHPGAPEGPFSREGGKLSLERVCLDFITNGGESSRNGLIDAFWDDPTQLPSEVALSRAREKVPHEAAEFCLKDLNSRLPLPLEPPDYILYAIDGTDDPFDTRLCASTLPYKVEAGSKYYFASHATALYNVTHARFMDITIQTASKKDEYAAACELLDRFSPAYPGTRCYEIVAADRGFECYNTIGHAVMNNIYLLQRAKDKNSTGIIGNLGIEFPVRQCWDIDVELPLTRSKSKKLREKYDNLRVLDKKAKFDYLKKGTTDVFVLKFRVVRIKIGKGKYECLITTLPREEFPPSRLKKLYAERWEIEVGFRTLKYTVGALYLHSRKPECMKTELIFTLIAYNITEYMMRCALERVSKAYHGKYKEYHANFSTSVHIMRLYLLHPDVPMETALAFMARDLVPKRLQRPSYPRGDLRSNRRRFYHNYRVS